MVTFNDNIVDELFKRLAAAHYNGWEPSYEVVLRRLYNRLSTEEQRAFAAFGTTCQQLGMWEEEQ